MQVKNKNMLTKCTSLKSNSKKGKRKTILKEYKEGT